MVFIAVLASLGTVALFGAADAGRAGEDHADAMRVMSGPLSCAADLNPRQTELRFETIDARTASGQTDLIAGGGMVNFQWNSSTGELSFTTSAARSPVTLPEDFVKRAAKTALTSCGSR